MFLKNRSIKSKLMTVILVTSTVVLLMTCLAYIVLEYYSFRKSTTDQLSLVGKIIASNSTAALAFNNTEDAMDILSSLESEPHLVGGVLYGMEGQVFTSYPADLDVLHYTGKKPDQDIVVIENDHVIGFYPVVQGNSRLGTLLLISDMGAMYARLKLYAAIGLAVIVFSLLVAYILSRILQKGISGPILDLAGTAREVSENTNYSIRATRHDNDEIGTLTAAFNHMLSRIEEQNREITTFSQQLENKVKERTLELEAAYKEMEAFSYSVSHDLNAPLRHIDSYLNMFLDDHGNELSEEGRKILDAVGRNSKKMRQLIDDLLTFSQAGRKELKKVPFSMDDLVRKICRTYQRQDNGRKVDFQVAVLPEVLADQSTMRQVWENLIGNAYKYTGTKPHATVKIDVQEKAGDYVFCVMDNGAGFDMNYYHHLFMPFQRLHTMSQFEGTGVGLAIVERIVSRHGGKIWAESEPDKGATFYFTLPRQPEMPGEAPQTATGTL